MKILVTGGSGFIGGHLARELACEGHDVFCLVRNLQKGEPLRKAKAILVIGDIRDIDLFKSVLKEIDLVYHLAGILGRWNIPNRVYHDVHVRGTENLLRACVKLKIRRFIHCSSVGVLGPTGNRLFDESFPYHPTSIYEQTKAEAEKLVLTYARENKIDTTVIRPAVVYGPGDFHMLGLFKAIKKGLFPLIGSGRALLQPTYVEDVIQGLKACIGNDRTVNQIYILAGEVPITVKEFVTIAAKIIGVVPPKVKIPCSIANFVAPIFEIAGRVSKFKPPLTRPVVKFFTENKAYRINKAIKELGYKPVGLEEGLRKTIEWYKNNGYL